jgi:hypothetical protein
MRLAVKNSEALKTVAGMALGMAAGAALALITMLFGSCTHRPIVEPEQYSGETAPLRVRIDWSRSGINETNRANSDQVHRVSVRFFPKDGSQAFDQYLELDVTQGEVRVPKGEYSVVVFNESIHDEGYWGENIGFVGVDSYDDFAAEALDYQEEARGRFFPEFQPAPEERTMVEPLPLASWSLDELVITEAMIKGREVCNALMDVRMRRLTPMVSVEAQVENLSSAVVHYVTGRGFAGRVKMASAKTENPSTQLFTIRAVDHQYYTVDGPDGIATRSVRTFGRTTETEHERYELDFDVVLVSGDEYKNDGLRFDVTDQMTVFKQGEDIGLKAHYTLPLYESVSPVTVTAWGDEEVIQLK